MRTWFEELDSSDWYASSPEVDAMLRDRFSDDLEREGVKPAASFLGELDTARAAILLSDQIPRNIHRDTAKAFAWDPLARKLTHGVLERGWLAGLETAQKQFILMPLMHSEEIADQDMSVELFAEHVPDALDFAVSHRKMIARFGRFPHRNDVLGRETTPEEQAAIDAGFSW
nr:DUF924 family protein [Qipengyuania intermedia]